MNKRHILTIFLILILSVSIVSAISGQCAEYDFDCDGEITLDDSTIINQYWRDATPITMNIVTGANCDNLTNYLAPFWQDGNKPITMNEATGISAQIVNCIEEIPCTTEGERMPVYPGYECCEGLVAINPQTTAEPLVGASICSNCGNGICEQWENQYNCPNDCAQNCAQTGEAVFINSTFGPTYCCSKNDGIKPISFLSGNACIAPTNGQKGTCIDSWWRTCGDGFCDIQNEDRCNCSEDCESSNLVKEKVSCIFNTTNQEKCYDSTEKYSCTSDTAIGTILDGGSITGSSCTIEVSGRKGSELNWKSSCGGYAQTIIDGISENVKFDCENNGEIKETVKCILEGAKGGEECYSSKGKCRVNLYENEISNSRTESTNSNGIQITNENLARNRYGSCTIDVRGIKGETVTWKSDCGGYAYTIMDGENEYANFSCNTKPPVREDLYQRANWTCTNEMTFSKEDTTCQPYSYWKKLAIRTCNQYSSTCGIPITLVQDVPTTSRNVTVTTDSNIEIIIIDDSNNAITECIGDLVTVKNFEVSKKCEQTCTSRRDSQGCTVTTCGEGPSITDCPAQNCKKQPIEEIRRIKNDCENKNGKVIVEINNSNGCSNYTCVSTNSNKPCITSADVSIERKLKCEDQNGKFIVNTNEDGCIDFMKCVGAEVRIENKEISKEIINDSIKLLELTLKLENLKMELIKIQNKINAVADFHNSNGDTNSALNFKTAASLVDEAIIKIDELKTFIKDNVDDFTKEDGQYVREVIAEIRGGLMKDILLAILG